MANGHDLVRRQITPSTYGAGAPCVGRSDRAVPNVQAAQSIVSRDARQHFLRRIDRIGWVPAFLAVAVLGSSCGPQREIGPGRAITDCDYCVVTEKYAHRFADPATEILDRTFVVVKDDDARLKNPIVKQKACLLQIEWSRGFWKSSATVEVRDYSNRALMLSSYVPGGMLYAGYHRDVLEALEDIAAARAEAAPVPAAARAEPPAAPPPGVAQSKVQRLTELNELRDRGLITEAEYSKHRSMIINER